MNLTAAEQASICSDGNACTQDLCDVATGQCAFPLENPLPVQCAQCTATTCDWMGPSTACSPVRCYKTCSDPSIRTPAACPAAVAANGTYCERQPVGCPANDVCNVWSCSDAENGKCVSSAAQPCVGVDACSVGQCSVAAGGCIFSDPCLGVSFGSNPCQQALCQLNATATNGFQCFGPLSPPRNCTDFRCSATDVTPQILVGPDAGQFMQQFASRNASCVKIECTEDICDPNLPQGCVNRNLVCAVSADARCNASIGCYEPGNIYAYPPGVCQEVVVTSLFDFCGTCLGDNVACFFSSVNTAGIAGGIAGGVVAAIVASAVIAALLAAFLSKKGYDYYQAQSQLKAVGLQNNPMFQDNTNQGSMPDLGQGAAF